MEQVCYNGPIYYICDKDNQCRRDPYIWAVSIFIQASCFGCLLLMSSFGYLTYTRLNTSYTNLSVYTCQIQHQLLTALLIQVLSFFLFPTDTISFKLHLIQAGIPIIFMCIPIAVLFTSPMFGIGFGVYQNITMACLAIYPPLDQLATMYVIRDFRDAIRNVLTVRKSDLARIPMTSESANRSRTWHY
ncbi:hypothetical protein CRE_01442 [Caenorhabditis remanei]|uniref:Uncharacterized protein n=1 Tax=Caenorhabditis remanei TaxID=31234 RepID=E3NMP1_CAERE|nr:hypothetical protein CRE_01442 [Caenorhabditis remanei]